MKRCKICGSYAFNLYKEDIDQGDLCDVHYWKEKALSTTCGEPVTLEEYDAGLLNDFGGGNVDWWQDYIRAELGRAYEHYQSQNDAEGYLRNPNQEGWTYEKELMAKLKAKNERKEKNT